MGLIEDTLELLTQGVVRSAGKDGLENFRRLLRDGKSGHGGASLGNKDAAERSAAFSLSIRMRSEDVRRAWRSWRRGRFLVGGEPDQMAIQRCGAIDGGRLISRDEVVGAPSSAHHGVETPDVV
jgi:hypothetical protein